MMKTTSFCYLLVGVSVVLSYHVDDLHLEWTNFKQTYNRQYSSHEEEMMRKNAFERNMKMVEMHNLMYHRGLKSYKMAFNKFSDMTPDEISSMNRFKIPSDNKGMGSKFLSPLNLAELPKEVDWRVKGLVTKPRDQGACQSCYAFSVVGAVEGQHARKTGKLVKLSEQNLVDCSTTYGNLACQGGYMEATFKYVVDHGIDTEESYPYIDGEQACKFRNDSVGATITGYKYIEQGNEQQLLEAVATVGPISAAIHAPLSLIYYSGGVYDSSDCNPKKLCHAVLIVGYGTENGKDYWIVKNSIGEYWGDKGYFKLLRNKNQCGIAEHAWFPTV